MKSLHMIRLASFLKYICVIFLSVQVSMADEGQGGYDQVSFEWSELSIQSGDAVHHFKVEIAQTYDQRERGLMYRREMPRQNGMLFLFESPRIVTMWMKNTYIPLDIIFIDSRGVIAHIAKSAKPESLDIISYPEPVFSILELNAGLTGQQNIQVGDKINYPLLAVTGK